MYWVTLALLALFIGLGFSWFLAIIVRTNVRWPAVIVFILGAAAILYLPTFYGVI